MANGAGVVGQRLLGAIKAPSGAAVGVGIALNPDGPIGGAEAVISG